MTTGTPGAPHRGEGDETITTLTGDRLCTRCGYNLTGQPVVREAHYGLLVVRCTECATVAAVQEYPLLGRWAQRLGVALAASWMLLVLAMWPGTVGAVFGGSLGVAEEMASRFGRQLDERYDSWLVVQHPQPPGTTVNWATRQQHLGTWWAEQDPAALLAESGGLLGQLHEGSMIVAVVMTLVCGGIGVLWSAVLINVRRRWLPLFAVSIAAAAVAIGVLRWASWQWTEPTWTWQFAGPVVGPPVLFTMLVWMIAAFAVGLWFGRPILRGLVRVVLPPTLRGSLSLLWRTDGLTLPR